MCQHIFVEFYEAGAEPAPNNSMTVEEVLEEALVTLDGVSLTPREAKLVLSFRAYSHAQLIVEGVLRPEDVASDELFALVEIASGDDERSFGEVYRPYHLSSANAPFLAGMPATSLAQEFASGCIWHEIAEWQSSHPNV